MIFIESKQEWDREAAWAAARDYARACRSNPNLRTYGVIAKRFRLAGTYGRRWVWGIFAGPLAEVEQDGRRAC